MIIIILDLAQVSFILPLVYFDKSSIIASCRSIKEFVSLISSNQTKILLGKPTQNLTRQDFIFTIAISNKRVIVFLCFRIFLILGFLFFQCFIATKTVCVAVQCQKIACQVALALVSTTCSKTTCQSSRLLSFSFNWTWLESCRSSRKYQIRKLSIGVVIPFNSFRPDYK